MEGFHFDLPDELIYRVLSFAFGVAVNGDESFDPKTGRYFCPFKRLLNTFNLVSKRCCCLSISYLQHTPLEISFESFYRRRDSNFNSFFRWACNVRLKIGELYIGSLQTVLDGNICMYLLRSCNVSELESFTIGNYSSKMRQTRQQDRLDAIDAGIPSEILKINIGENADYLALIGNYLRSNEAMLKTLRIRISKAQEYSPLLTNFSQSIEDLTLEIAGCGKIYSREENVDRDMERLTKLVKNMVKLRKINIWSFFTANIEIISNSLEEINVSDSKEGFWITKCACPSLKKFSFKYLCNGMPLQHPISQEALELKTQTIDSKTSAFGLPRAPMVFLHGSRPLIGAEIPDTCLIEANITDLTLFKMWTFNPSSN